MALKRTTRTLLARAKARKSSIPKIDKMTTGAKYSPPNRIAALRSRAAKNIKMMKKDYGRGTASRTYITQGHDTLKNRNTQLDQKSRLARGRPAKVVAVGRVRSNKRKTPRSNKPNRLQSLANKGVRTGANAMKSYILGE